MKDSDQENQKHIETIYKEKSIKFLKFCIAIFIFDAFTYLIALFFFKSFDFGLIFEIISFVFIMFAMDKISRRNFASGKTNIIIAMIPVGWLIIYDFINLIIYIKEVIAQVVIYYTSFDSYFYYLTPYLVDVSLVAIIILLYKAYSYLNLADGTKKPSTYTDKFYDSL